jgi:hypothetical protein
MRDSKSSSLRSRFSIAPSHRQAAAEVNPTASIAELPTTTPKSRGVANWYLCQKYSTVSKAPHAPNTIANSPSTHACRRCCFKPHLLSGSSALCTSPPRKICNPTPAQLSSGLAEGLPEIRGWQLTRTAAPLLACLARVRLPLSPPSAPRGSGFRHTRTGSRSRWEHPPGFDNVQISPEARDVDPGERGVGVDIRGGGVHGGETGPAGGEGGCNVISMFS